MYNLLTPQIQILQFSFSSGSRLSGNFQNHKFISELRQHIKVAHFKSLKWIFKTFPDKPFSQGENVLIAKSIFY